MVDSCRSFSSFHRGHQRKRRVEMFLAMIHVYGFLQPSITVESRNKSLTI